MIKIKSKCQLLLFEDSSKICNTQQKSVIGKAIIKPKQYWLVLVNVYRQYKPGDNSIFFLFKVKDLVKILKHLGNFRFSNIWIQEREGKQLESLSKGL